MYPARRHQIFRLWTITSNIITFSIVLWFFFTLKAGGFKIPWVFLIVSLFCPMVVGHTYTAIAGLVQGLCADMWYS
jgi:hypothetical protein